MKWHFLWERSLLIPALKKLRFVFSYWLLWPFLTPMPIQLRRPHCGLVCSANLRIYIESDLLPMSCHPGYPGKCHNLEQVQPDQRQRRHKDVTTWATWCGIARDSVASRYELSQRNDKKTGGTTSSGSHFQHIRCDIHEVDVIIGDMAWRAMPKEIQWDSISRQKQSNPCLGPLRSIQSVGPCPLRCSLLFNSSKQEFEARLDACCFQWLIRQMNYVTFYTADATFPWSAGPD